MVGNWLELHYLSGSSFQHRSGAVEAARVWCKPLRADDSYYTSGSCSYNYGSVHPRMGNILNVGYEKILLLYNSATYSTADVISTYTYRLSFGGSGNPNVFKVNRDWIIQHHYQCFLPDAY